MKVELFDTRKNVISTVVSTNAHGMLSVLINMASRDHTCSYQGSSLKLIERDDTGGALPKHVCFRVYAMGIDVLDDSEKEVVVIAESIAEEALLKGLHYESQCKEQHEFIFVPHSMLNWKQAAITRNAATSVPCTVYDHCEGRLHIQVKAASNDEADEEASIAAAEMGCTHVTEIVVGVHE